MDDANLDEEDNSIVTNAVHTSGSNSKALVAMYFSSGLARRRNLPWGQPLRLLWTQHHGGVLNAGNNCLLAKHFRRGPVKTCRGGNTCMMSSKDNQVFYTSQKV